MEQRGSTTVRALAEQLWKKGLDQPGKRRLLGGDAYRTDALVRAPATSQDPLVEAAAEGVDWLVKRRSIGLTLFPSRESAQRDGG